MSNSANTTYKTKKDNIRKIKQEEKNLLRTFLMCLSCLSVDGYLVLQCQSSLLKEDGQQF